MDLAISPLGRTPDGQSVERYVLRNRQGITADLMNYGAALMALRTPDRHGRLESIVLGFDTLEPYLAGTPYFGATIGRYANRIAGARFELGGVEYRFAANDGRNHIHGGLRGFDKMVWAAQPFREADSAGVAFFYISANGEEGYPGELAVEVTYRLSDANRLSITYAATTTKPTHVNLTHHSYFNLSGDALREITSHHLMINADQYTPVNAELIPTGVLRGVAVTPFDFRAPRAIGADIDSADEQLRLAGGYDHNFVLNKTAPDVPTCAAVLSDPDSGRVIEVWTTEPGLQFYSGNSLGGRFKHRSGLCLEPQHFPNSPNEPRFPSTILRPGERYSSRTVFQLLVRAN
ncbi:MAG TPA: aldose epimerase family protein [Vitreimonas sp.]|nr:aldose epimerase family protein [Vitreimonas sp.]